MVTGEFILYFESPFWVGLFLRDDESGAYAARHVFGGEPGYPEILEFLKNSYDSLVFLKIPDTEMEEMILRHNRLSHRQVRKNRNDIPKSLEIYKNTLQQDKIRRRTSSRRDTREQIEEKYQKKRDKARLKKRGR